MENPNDYRGMYEFFQSMSDSAIDIYWGNDPELTPDEADTLKPADCIEAFNKACAVLAWDSINAPWLLELPAQLAKYYGQQLKTVYVRKTLASLFGDIGKLVGT